MYANVQSYIEDVLYEHSSETMKPDIRRWPLQSKALTADCTVDNLEKLSNLPAPSYLDH